MHCDRCGRQASEADRFCAGCGATLSATEPAAPLAESEPVAPVFGAAMPPPPLPDSPPVESPAYASPMYARVPEPTLPYAGFWRRFVALLLDAMLLFFPQAILRVLLGLPVFSYDDEWGDKAALTAEVCGLALAVVYCAALEASGGQGSLGQQMMGLAVTDSHGRRIGFGRALARQFAKVLSTLLCGVGYLLQLWNGKRQTLHDMICGCLVLRQAPERDREAGDVRMVVTS